MAGTITTGYDDFGRTTTTTDADGAATLQAYDGNGRPSTITWKRPSGVVLGTHTTTYNSATERRGLPTGATDSALPVGAFTATYDADGAITGQVYPNGLTQTITRDPAGQRTDLLDTLNGVEWHHGIQTYNAQGQALTSSVAGVYAKTYTYEPTGRLSTAAFNWTGGSTCDKNSYTFDVNGNRLTKARITDNGVGGCTTPTTTTSSYDNADRLLNVTTGTTSTNPTYDAWGRTTILPTPLAGSAGNGGVTNVTANLANTFYVTDAVAAQTQGSVTDTWTLDPAGRRRVFFDGNTPKTNHYSGGGDSPSWIDEGWTSPPGSTNAATRYIPDLSGQPAYTYTQADGWTDTHVNVITLHGDIDITSHDYPTGNVIDGPGLVTDEYGITGLYGSQARYGWLGTNQRANDSLGSTMLMGARLYAPSLGRFLTTDPVHGGNENTYTYPNDPINAEDTSGMASSPESLTCLVFGTRVCAGVFAVSTLVKNVAAYRLHYISVREEDAVRHFAWQAILTFLFGWRVANFVGNAHEYDDQHSGNAARLYSSNIDLANNGFARGWSLNNSTWLAARYRSGGLKGLINDLINMGISLYNSGRLKRDYSVPGRQGGT
jgi:RHS repeat-associated protein